MTIKKLIFYFNHHNIYKTKLNNKTKQGENIKIKFLYLILSIFLSNNCLIFHEKFAGQDFSHYLKTFHWTSEGKAYLLLKKDPINKNVNFLAAPIKPLNNLYNNNKLYFTKLNGGFAVTSYPYYEKFIPVLKEIGVNVLFATGAKNKTYGGIKVLAFPHIAYNGVAPHPIKNIYYSFIGAQTHSVRRKIFSMQHPPGTIIKKREKFHFVNWDKGLINSDINKKIEYQDVLSKSRFSLCPRGTGSGSFRFWESLQAGAIPILISDEYLLPIGFNWEECIIRVPEKDVEKIPQIIAKIPIDKEIRMRKNCIKAYSMFSGENLVKVIRDYYAKHN